MQGVPHNQALNVQVVEEGVTVFPAPTDHLGARVVRQVAPGEVATQIRNAFHQFMWALGDPLRTLSRLHTLHNDAWSHVAREMRRWSFDSIRPDVFNLRAQHLARNEEFNRRGEQVLFADLTRAFNDVLETDMAPGTYEELQRLIGLADLATSTPLTAAERLSDGTPDRPGAYQVTAAAAAAVGRYGNAAPPLREPEAIAVVGIDKDQLPADIIGRTAKTPNNPNGYPVVHAENVREASHDIPLVRAYRADLLTDVPLSDEF